MTRHVNIRLSQKKFKFLETFFPAQGSKQWFFEACIDRLISLHEAGEVVSPSAAVEAVLDTFRKDFGSNEHPTPNSRKT